MSVEENPHDDVKTPELRPYLWGALGLTAFYLLIAFPVVITLGWEFLIRLAVIGWAALGFAYWLRRRK